jgi:hypothetical protein
MPREATTILWLLVPGLIEGTPHFSIAGKLATHEIFCAVVIRRSDSLNFELGYDYEVGPVSDR